MTVPLCSRFTTIAAVKGSAAAAGEVTFPFLALFSIVLQPCINYAVRSHKAMQVCWRTVRRKVACAAAGEGATRADWGGGGGLEWVLSQARYTHLEAEALPAEFYLSAGVINLGFGVLKHAAVPVLPLQETGITVGSIHNTSLYCSIYGSKEVEIFQDYYRVQPAAANSWNCNLWHLNYCVNMAVQ